MTDTPEREGEWRRFPVQRGPSIPWRAIAPYKYQVKVNHGQTLERLAERGGLDPVEVRCAVEGKRLSNAVMFGNYTDEQRAADLAWLEAWRRPYEDDEATITALREERDDYKRAGELLGEAFRAEASINTTLRARVSELEGKAGRLELRWRLICRFAQEGDNERLKQAIWYGDAHLDSLTAAKDQGG